MQNVKPKKQLGQHFLTDANIARKIALALAAPMNEPVVEIGPGTGMLTRHLLERGDLLKVVEYDTEAATFLHEEYPTLQIVQGDFLRQPLDTLASGPTWWIGNLPYNISSPIFFHLLESMNLVKGGVFMVQKEVAQRICSPHGSKEYGILSVLLGYYFAPKYLFSVSDKVFFPRPKVQSAVFSLTRRQREQEVPYTQLHPVVKAAFGQRRKTLRNALSVLQMDLSAVPEAMLSQRAEQLSVDQFETLTLHLFGHASAAHSAH
jgi:16S rRNA (adenine1518-N6/adenine1519-N6)-dimethyltransferase